jgi:hypothetical protein
MAAPTVTPLPTAPNPVDPVEEFDADAYAWAAALGTLVTELNALITWLNANVAAQTIVTISGTTYSPLAAQSGQFIRFTNAGTKTIEVQPDSTVPQPDGATWNMHNANGGNMEIVEGSGVTIQVPAGGSLEVPAGGAVSLVRVGEDSFVLIGQTVPA